MQSLFFDFDGTLVDSERFHAVNWSEYLATHGVELSVADFLKYHAGVIWPDIAQYFIDENQLTISVEQVIIDMEALTEAKIRLQGIPAMPGVDRLIKSFAGKVPMAVVTGAPREYVEGVLAQHGWLSLFDGVFSGYEVQNNKPAPDVYLQACRVMNVEPSQVVALEDSRTGMMAAQNAQITCMLITTHSFVEESVDYTFPTINEATPLLTSMFNCSL